MEVYGNKTFNAGNFIQFILQAAFHINKFKYSKSFEFDAINMCVINVVEIYQRF